MRLGYGAVAQLGERLVCNQEATGSIPVSSTRFVNAVMLNEATLSCSELPGIRILRYAQDDMVVRREKISNLMLGVNATPLSFHTVHARCLAPNIGLTAVGL